MCIYNVHVCVYGLYMSMKVTGQFQSIGRGAGEGEERGKGGGDRQLDRQRDGKEVWMDKGRREGVM